MRGFITMLAILVAGVASSQVFYMGPAPNGFEDVTVNDILEFKKCNVSIVIDSPYDIDGNAIWAVHVDGDYDLEFVSIIEAIEYADNLAVCPTEIYVEERSRRHGLIIFDSSEFEVNNGVRIGDRISFNVFQVTTENGSFTYMNYFVLFQPNTTYYIEELNVTFNTAVEAVQYILNL